MKTTWHSRTAFAAASAFLIGVGASPVDDTIFAGNPANAQIVLDQRPAEALSDNELKARIKLRRDRIKGGDVSKKEKKALRAAIRKDRAALANRGDQDEDSAGETETPEQKNVEQIEQTPSQRPTQDPATQVETPLKKTQDNAEDTAANGRRELNSEARALLSGAEAAGTLSDRELRRRIGRAEELASDDRLRSPLRRKLGELADADRTELQRRGDVAEQPATRQKEPEKTDRAEDTDGETTRSGKESTRVRRLLDDKRDPSQLNDKQLRKRLRRIRDALREDDVSKKQSKLLRQRLRADREVLRSRVAERESGNVEKADVRPDDDRDNEILRNNTPSDELSRGQLRHRVKALRAELNRDDISDDRRARLERRLKTDRRELRALRKARREERRERLRNARRNDEISIVIGGDFSIGVGGNAPVAEIRDEDLMRQLTAAPRRRIDRRFSASEIEDHPEVREMVPGIEVDTITFAFNEYQIGPEEVDELERIGVAIERIVAAHPNEVFLIEGHTDAVGGDAYNQNLSEQRAASVMEALVEYFVIDPENLVAVGYGERFLRIPTPEAEQENRRVTLRRATPFMRDRSG